ncbi:MAG: cyclic nucleotide-binding domain-containing protein [Ignavibacteria bacterium]|nr:cyclic nucleotide-binding domain-containing protein [Ignavibacteria bacterium]
METEPVTCISSATAVLRCWSAEDKLIGTLQTGDFFGEMALPEKRRRGASIRAIEHTDLYVLDATAFDHIPSRVSLSLEM